MAIPISTMSRNDVCRSSGLETYGEDACAIDCDGGSTSVVSFWRNGAKNKFCVVMYVGVLSNSTAEDVLQGPHRTRRPSSTTSLVVNKGAPQDAHIRRVNFMATLTQASTGTI